jgi:ATP-dependent RNA helicase RhlB
MTDQPPKPEHVQDDDAVVDQPVEQVFVDEATTQAVAETAMPASSGTPAAQAEPELAADAEEGGTQADAPAHAPEADAETAPQTDGGPEEPVRFEELALPEPLTRAITELGFEECTPIQGRSLPFSLSDYDVTGQAQTGTGKTAAFLITLLTRFWENPPQERPNLGTPRALVLAPTRELALQIQGDAEGLAKYMGMSTVCLVGGMDFDRQREELVKQPVDILVGTPGRLIDFLERRDINLSKVECLVIDEADRMLDMGFIPDVRRIVYQTPHKRKRQTLFFSATFNEAVMRLADSWTIDPEHIVVEPESVATDTVDQKSITTHQRGPLSSPTAATEPTSWWTI